MNLSAPSGTARLPGCDVEVCARQAGSRRASKSPSIGTPEQSPCRGRSHTLIRIAVFKVGFAAGKVFTAVPLDSRTLALVELLSTLWQERRAIQDMANDSAVSDADLRSFCRGIALPPTQEDMAWAMKQMEHTR